MTIDTQISKTQADGRASALAGRYDLGNCLGIGLQQLFNDAFVSASALVESLPADTPPYLAGRIAFLKGASIEAKPETETYSDRWVSGWLDERDRAKAQNR